MDFTSISENEFFPSLDQSSTMIWRRISIESVLKSILSVQMNLCLFSRSNLDSDQNTVVDRKWLELTSLSADGIFLFSRFIFDNNLNSLADPKLVKFIGHFS